MMVPFLIQKLDKKIRAKTKQSKKKHLWQKKDGSDIFTSISLYFNDRAVFL